MKTLSGTFKLVVVVMAIGVLTILTFRAFAQQPASAKASDATFTLKIKDVAALKDGSTQGKNDFKETLKKLGTQSYRIRLVHGNGQADENINAGPDPGPNAKLELKTDKVTTSEIAKNASTAELTLIQVHATIQIASRNPADIIAVLNKLAP
jgi:hypothetical protein